MDNKLESKTRLAAIQLVSQQLVNNKEIDIVKTIYNWHKRKVILNPEGSKSQHSMILLQTPKKASKLEAELIKLSKFMFVLVQFCQFFAVQI